MARRNNQTNALIKWAVMAGDLLLLNGLLALFRWLHPYLQTWSGGRVEVLWVVCNLAMAITMWKFSTIIHLRMVSGGDILRRVFELTIMQTIIAYLVMKAIDVNQPVGWLLIQIGIWQIGAMVIVRIVERYVIKRYRMMGGNTRMVTFIGSDPELDILYERLVNNPTLGYEVKGYYGERAGKGKKSSVKNIIRRLGSLQELMAAVEKDEVLELGDEIYVCLSRREGETVRALSDYCDNHMIRFYYLPVSVELLGMRLKRELFDDMELFHLLIDFLY